MSEHYRILTGENAAEAYLVARGAKVRERNFRTRAGEIDLIVELGWLHRVCGSEAAQHAAPGPARRGGYARQAPRVSFSAPRFTRQCTICWTRALDSTLWNSRPGTRTTSPPRLTQRAWHDQ